MSLTNKILANCMMLSACALVMAFSPYARAELACETTNLALESMPDAIVALEYENGETKEFSVRLANNSTTRAVGFQRACESTIAAKPILFVFEQAVRPSFHMNNVVAAIDIAFIDADGKIDSIHAMLPYVLGAKDKPRYRPNGYVVSALETYPGFYAEHEVDDSVKISWRLAEK